MLLDDLGEFSSLNLMTSRTQKGVSVCFLLTSRECVFEILYLDDVRIWLNASHRWVFGPEYSSQVRPGRY